MLKPEEFNRYQRHISLSEVGVAGQVKIKEAKVLVIGAGGLGSPVLQYLTAAGVGTIGIVDGDLVDESNLQRQVVFSSSDIGKSKVDVAVKRLKDLNEHVNFVKFNEYITRENALKIMSSFDVIVDGTDNFEARFLIGDASLILNKPLVYGAIFKYEGQVSVFNYIGGPSLRCLFPNEPKKTDVPNCSQTGVLGVLPGFIGMQMCNEVLKVILGIGEVLSGVLLVSHLLNNSVVKVKITKVQQHFDRTELEQDYSLLD